MEKGHRDDLSRNLSPKESREKREQKAEERRKESRDQMTEERRKRFLEMSEEVRESGSILRDLRRDIEMKMCRSILVKEDDLMDDLNLMDLSSGDKEEKIKRNLDRLKDHPLGDPDFNKGLQWFLDEIYYCLQNEAESLLDLGVHTILIDLFINHKEVREEVQVRYMIAHGLLELRRRLPRGKQNLIPVSKLALDWYLESTPPLSSAADFACEVAATVWKQKDETDNYRLRLLDVCHRVIESWGDPNCWTNSGGGRETLREFIFAHACRTIRLAAQHIWGLEINSTLDPVPLGGSELLDSSLLAYIKTENTDQYTLENAIWALNICGSDDARFAVYSDIVKILKVHPAADTRAACIWFLSAMPSVNIDVDIIDLVGRALFTNHSSSIIGSLCITLNLILEGRHEELIWTECITGACRVMASNNDQLRIAALRVIVAAARLKSPNLIRLLKDTEGDQRLRYLRGTLPKEIGDLCEECCQLLDL
jgi:hypothetical protein